jgi:uncharacterized protein with PQ loop repeat
MNQSQFPGACIGNAEGSSLPFLSLEEYIKKKTAKAITMSMMIFKRCLYLLFSIYGK